MTLEELWDFEDKHPVVFASPRALLEARMIAEMDKARHPRRRARRVGVGNLPRQCARTVGRAGAQAIAMMAITQFNLR